MSENQLSEKNYIAFKKELDDIRNTVYSIKNEKQDKIKPLHFAGVILFILTYTFSAVWWGSNLTSSVQYLNKDIEKTYQFMITEIKKAGEDRYKGKDAIANNALIDQRFQYLSAIVEKNNNHIRSLEEDLSDYKANTKSNHTRLQRLENINNK